MRKKFESCFNNFIMPLLGTSGLNYTLSIVCKEKVISNNIFISFIFFALLVYLYNKVFKKEKIIKKYIIFSIFFSLLISFIIILGLELEMYSKIIWTFNNFINCFFLAIFIFPIIYLATIYMENIHIKEDELNIKYINLITFGVIFFFTFLVYLALYPGVYGYDSIYQIDRIYKGYMDTHYSVLFCVMIGGMVKLGGNLFNSYQIGVGIFVLLQMIVLSFVSSKVAIETYNYTKSKKIYFATLIFYCFFTFYKIMVVSVAQDVLFAAFFSLIFIRLLKISTNQKKYVEKKLNFILIAIDVLMLCLLRNNGLYALLFVFPFLLMIKGKEKIVVLISFIIPIIIYKIITGPIYGMLDIKSENDGIKEALSIPTQQLSRIYVYNKDAFNKKDIEKLKKYYNDIDGLETYKKDSSISDLQKNHTNKENIKNDLIGYLKFYLRMGEKDTKNYIEAFLLNNLGIWFPNKSYPDTRMFHPLIEYDMTLVNDNVNTGYIGVERNSKIPFYEKFLNWLVKGNNWQNIPVISTIFTLGFYFLINMFMIGVVIMRKRWKLLIPISLIIGLYVTILLAPVALFRYCFPIIMCTPLVCVITIKENMNEGKCKGE